MAQPKKSGSIPENLTLFARDETQAGFSWEDVKGGDIKHKVRPVYISDSTNVKTKETGLNWMNQSYGVYEGNKWVTRKNVGTIVETPNTPISNIRIVTLEIRDKGGRAYKCMADIGELKGAYFDMREDVLLDCMFQQGIQLGGICEGPFIFARVDSQMKPVRIDSLLHTKMIEATKHNEAAIIKEYEVGGVYTNKKCDEFVYVGKGYTRDCPKWKYHYSIYSHRRDGEYKYQIQFPKEVVYYTTDGLTKSEPRHVFLERGFTDPQNNKTSWAVMKRYKETYSSSYIKMVKAPTYKTQIGKIEIEQTLRDWIFDHNTPRHSPTTDNLSETQGYTNPLYAHIPEL